MIKNNKGITLISLVVTIVVMLILAISLTASVTSTIELQEYNKVKEDINNDLYNGYSLIIDNIQYNKIPMDINIDDYILTTDETNKEIILIKDKE